MTERTVFGQELQRKRERCGLTLEQMAERTKISASLFAGLERGDLSRWPAGIFRRAFVRAYAQCVGLDPEETVARFLRAHPDGEAEVVASVASPRAEEAEAGDAFETPQLRLVLDQALAPRPSTGWRTLRRVGAPALDLLLAGVPALIVALVLGWAWFWVVAGAIGLVGHLLLFSVAATTPGGWLLLRGPARPTLVSDSGSTLRRRPEAESSAVNAARRRPQPRHATAARPMATARPRRVQH